MDKLSIASSEGELKEQKQAPDKTETVPEKQTEDNKDSREQNSTLTPKQVQELAPREKELYGLFEKYGQTGIFTRKGKQIWYLIFSIMFAGPADVPGTQGAFRHSYASGVSAELREAERYGLNMYLQTNPKGSRFRDILEDSKGKLLLNDIMRRVYSTRQRIIEPEPVQVNAEEPEISTTGVALALTIANRIKSFLHLDAKLSLNSARLAGYIDSRMEAHFKAMDNMTLLAQHSNEAQRYSFGCTIKTIYEAVKDVEHCVCSMYDFILFLDHKNNKTKSENIRLENRIAELEDKCYQLKQSIAGELNQEPAQSEKIDLTEVLVEDKQPASAEAEADITAAALVERTGSSSTILSTLEGNALYSAPTLSTPAKRKRVETSTSGNRLSIYDRVKDPSILSADNITEYLNNQRKKGGKVRQAFLPTTVDFSAMFRIEKYSGRRNILKTICDTVVNMINIDLEEQRSKSRYSAKFSTASSVSPASCRIDSVNKLGIFIGASRRKLRSIVKDILQTVYGLEKVNMDAVKGKEGVFLITSPSAPAPRPKNPLR